MKGFGRRLTKKALEEQAEIVISKMNTGLSERDKFCVGEGLRILAWNGEYSVALVFSNSADFERFYRRSGSTEVKGRFLWEDPLSTEGPKVLRVHKDASFDQRLRSQVFYNLRKEVVAHLNEKKVWDSDKMEVIDSGIKGTVFLTAGDEIYDLFKVNINHGEGRSHYVKPVYETFSHPWGEEGGCGCDHDEGHGRGLTAGEAGGACWQPLRVCQGGTREPMGGTPGPR